MIVNLASGRGVQYKGPKCLPVPLSKIRNQLPYDQRFYLRNTRKFQRKRAAAKNLGVIAAAMTKDYQKETHELKWAIKNLLEMLEVPLEMLPPGAENDQDRYYDVHKGQEELVALNQKTPPKEKLVKMVGGILGSPWVDGQTETELMGLKEKLERDYMGGVDRNRLVPFKELRTALGTVKEASAYIAGWCERIDRAEDLSVEYAELSLDVSPAQRRLWEKMLILKQMAEKSGDQEEVSMCIASISEESGFGKAYKSLSRIHEEIGMFYFDEDSGAINPKKCLMAPYMIPNLETAIRLSKKVLEAAKPMEEGLGKLAKELYGSEQIATPVIEGENVISLSDRRE